MADKNGTLTFLGWFFLIWGIGAIIFGVFNGGIHNLFWFCYLGLVLIGLGILLRKSWLVASIWLVLAIPLIVWDIDFIHYFITQKSLWGLTNYFFLSDFPLIGRIISLQHLFTVPLVLYTLYLMKLKSKSFWIWSSLYVVIIYIISRYFISAEINLNCAHRFCGSYVFIPGYYPLIWFAAYVLMIAISYFFLRNIEGLWNN